jgi:hypothetical protein
MTPFIFPRDVEDSVLRLCQDISSPRSLTVAILIKYREWDQLVSLKVDPSSYTDPLKFKKDAAVTSILRKCGDLPTTIDRRQAAVDNFWDGERSCMRANLRLQPFLDHVVYPLTDEQDMVVLSFIEAARKTVAEILGPCPDLIEGRFGPGATYGDKGQYTTVPDKMSSCPTLTSSAYPFLFQWGGTQWASACASDERNPNFVPGNRFTTVPKDSTKDRGIAVEPSINLFYQLGYGSVLKNRLSRAGLDLLKAQQIHRQVAYESSIRGHFATLDLSNASDTVCSNLVKLLLPRRWFEALNMLRSPRTLIDGKWVLLEKFSSMGNGFTFELETLLFLALSITAVRQHNSLAVVGEDVYVFGDDIIVPTESVQSVMSVLRFFGQSINKTKSFVEGPFRESCGGDYFEGMDVRPYFLKELPYEPQQYIAMANGIRRMGLTDPNDDNLYDFIRRSWFRVLDALPNNIRRLRGPEALGDLVIHDTIERWSTRTRSSIRYIRVYRPASFREVAWANFKPDVILAGATYGLRSPHRKGWAWDVGGGVNPRDAVLGYKCGWVPYS